MLKFQSHLVNPTLFTATPPGAGRSLDVTKILSEDSRAAIFPILPNTITWTYTQGQTEQIENPTQTGNTAVCSSLGMGVNQQRGETQT